MKVLVTSPGASWSTSDVEAGLLYGLQYHGIDIVRYRLDARIDRSSRWLHSNWRRARKTNPSIEKPNVADVFYQAGIGVLEQALRHQVDVVLVVSAMYLHPDIIILLKRAGLRVVILFTETPYDLEKELNVAKLVDGCWTNERTSVAAFQAVNPHVGYLPHAWHPTRHLAGPQPGDALLPAHDVVFVGSGFHERITWLSAIDWTGINLGLYGNWDSLSRRHLLQRYIAGGLTPNATATALYRRARIGLNLYRTSKGWGPNAPPIAYAESLNPRAYELAACGVVHVSTYRAEIPEVFGDLVPTFDTPDEAERQIRTALNGDAATRSRIASLLPSRVAESSWVQRAAQVIGDLQTLIRSRAA